MPACPACGERLPTMAGLRQHHTKVHGHPLPNRTCKDCGQAFYDPKSRRSYCEDCNPNAGPNNGNWRNAKTTTNCERCGSTFAFYPSEKPGRYCPECVATSEEFLGTPSAEFADATRVSKQCEQCGQEMEVLESTLQRGQGRFCSRDCLGNWLSENRTGPSHHQWVAESRSGWYSGKWWTIRRAALERDDHECQICGASSDELGRDPDVHHIEPIRSFEDPQQAHDLDNVVALCRSCHRLVEEGQRSLEDGQE